MFICTGLSPDTTPAPWWWASALHLPAHCALLPALWSPAACRVGDASRLDKLAPLAGVVSVFGLQQMPQPAAVLANWTQALAPGGWAAVWRACSLK